MPDWVQSGYNEYAKRLRQDWSLELIEIPNAKRSKHVDVSKLREQEGQKLLQQCKRQDITVALDAKGRALSTAELTQQLSGWMQHASTVNFLIGGPDGLSQSCLQASEFQWSLSPLTFPHPLVRIIVAEQLYRAWSLHHGHPYHRE